MKDRGHPRHIARHVVSGTSAAMANNHEAALGHAFGLVFNLLALYVRLAAMAIKGIVRLARR